MFLQWAEHYAALTRLAVGQTLMVNQLVDMEWKFGGKKEQTWRARQTWLTLEVHSESVRTFKPVGVCSRWKLNNRADRDEPRDVTQRPV